MEMMGWWRNRGDDEAGERVMEMMEDTGGDDWEWWRIW